MNADFKLARSQRRLKLENLEDRTVFSIGLLKDAFANVIAGLNSQMGEYQDVMNAVADAGTTALPVIGQTAGDLFGPSSASPGAKNVNGVINAIRSQLSSLEAGVRDSSTPEFDEEALKQAVFPYLEPFLGENGGDPNTITADDIIVTDFDPAAGTVGFDITLSETVSVSHPLNFNLGIPGFPFEVTAGGVVGMDMTFAYNHLRFGLDGGSFHIDNSAQDELSVALKAYYQSGDLEAQFGFLKVRNQEGRTPELGLIGKLTFDVGGPDLIQNPKFNLDARVRLPFETVSVDVPVADFQLPTVKGELALDWPIANVDPRAGLTEFGGAPHVALNDVSINFGGLMKYVAGPMAKYLRFAMAPTEVFVKTINAPIPGLSDLWEDVFDKKLSILTLANVASDIGAIPEPYSLIIKAVNLVSDVSKSFSSLTDDTLFSTDLFNTYLPLGSVDFTNLAAGINDLRSAPKSWGDQPISDWLADPLHLNIPLTTLTPYAQAVGRSLTDALENDVPAELKGTPGYQGAVSALKDKLQAMGSNISLKFPIISDPAGSVFKLFTGQDFQFANFTVDLRAQRLARTDTIGMGLDSFPNPVPLRLNGDMTMDLYVNMGFDTRGLRSALAKGPFGVFDGFNFDYHDPEHPGQFRDILRFNGKISADAGLTLTALGVRLFAGLSGYVQANDVRVGFDDPNRDGYFRPFSEFNGLGRLFETHGKVTAGLEVSAYERDPITGTNYILGPWKIADTGMIDLDKGPDANPFNPYPDVLDAIKRGVGNPPPRVTVDDATIVERTNAATPAVASFTVRLSAPTDSQVTVNYQTTLGGTAAATDFTAVNGMLTFAPGEYEKVVEVPITGDAAMEDNETFLLNLTGAINGVIVDNAGLGTIIDDDVEALFPTPVGDVDKAWAADGVFSTPAPYSGVGSAETVPTTTRTQTTVDSNGRLVVFSQSESYYPGYSPGGTRVTRLNPNGQPDATFAGTGTTYRSPVGISGYLTGLGLGAVYQSGPNRDKIITVDIQDFGGQFNDSFTQVVLTRFNADGSVDTNFRNGEPPLTFSALAWPSDTNAQRGINRINAVSIIPSGPNAGKIVLLTPGTGYESPYEFAVVRLNPNGTLDSTYGTGGVALVPKQIAFRVNVPTRMTVGTDGAVYLGGDDAISKARVTKLTPEGVLDGTFGIDGRATSDLAAAPGGTGAAYTVTAMTLQQDGKIVVGATGSPFNGVYDCPAAVARLNPDGTLDPSFAGSGVRVGLSGLGDQRATEITSVAVTPSGQIVIGGEIISNSLLANGLGGDERGGVVARFNTDGSPDSSFDTAGKDASMTVPALANRTFHPIRAVTLDQTGNVYAAGLSVNNGTIPRTGSVTARKYTGDRADLAVTVSTPVHAVAVGDEVTYTVRVSNTKDTADRPGIRIPLPAGATFVSLAPPDGWVVSTPAVGDGGEIVAAAHSLTAESGEQIFTLVVRYDAVTKATTTLTASVASDTADGELANNTASVTLSAAPASSAAYRLSVLADQPAGYWRLNEASPANGSATADYSGNGQVGRYFTANPLRLVGGQSGAITWETDRAVRFAGTEQGNGAAVTLPADAFALPAGTPFWMVSRSFEVWFKTTAGGVILGSVAGATGADPETFTNPDINSSEGDGTPAVYVDATGRVHASLFRQHTVYNHPIVSGAGYADGEYHHLVVTLNGQNQTLYLDGNVVGTATSSNPTIFDAGAAYYLGAGPVNGWIAGDDRRYWYFQGELDEAAVYRTTLTPAAVQAHYTAATAATPTNNPPTNLALSNATVAENLPAGTAVGQLSVDDADIGDVAYYSIIGGGPNGQAGIAGPNEISPFYIEGNTLRTTRPLNFEAQSAYSVTVRARDTLGEFTTRTLAITVTDAPDAPTLNPDPPLVMTAVAVSSTKHTGKPSSALLINAADEDAVTTLKVAVTGFVGMTGTWQHGPAADGPWTAITSPTENAPAVLATGEFIRFLPARGKTGYAGLRFRSTDGGLLSTAADTAWVPVGVTAKFDTSGRAQAMTLSEDTVSANGVTAGSLVAYTSLEFPGVKNFGLAITGTSGSGTWEVKSGTRWVPIGAVSEFEARLLKPTDAIRFSPVANSNGEATLTYRAWKIPAVPKGTSLPTVGNVNDSQMFSREPATAVVTVKPVNDAPTLDVSIARVFTLDSKTVAQLLSGADDIDSLVAGIAVTRAAAKNGRWEYQLTNEDWKPFPTAPAISSSTALLLDMTAQVRFVRNIGATVVTGSFDYKVRDDSTTFRAGTRSATTTTAYSKAFETATYSYGNHTPEFQPGLVPTLKHSAKTPTLINVSTLTGRMKDADVGFQKGIAVTGLSGVGLWEYCIDGVTWNHLDSLANGSLLLRSTDRLRFTPSAAVAGEATVRYRAWDQTTGGAGDRLPFVTDAESLEELTATLTLN